MISSGVASAVQASGVKALRYPGGSDSDVFNFISGTDQSMNDGAYWNSSDTFANFMSDLAIPSGSTPIITVNYGSNLSNNGGGEPSVAASWVQYANVTNNYGIVYWEIGNETYGNGYYTNWNWEYDLHYLDQTAANRVGQSVLSPAAYGTNAAAFIQAMKAVDPTIKCGISVNTSPYSPGWDQDVFQAISSALSGTGLYPDFVIVHWYPSGTNAQILAAQAGIPAQVAQIRSDLNNYYSLSNKDAIQILITETGPGDLTTVGGGILPFLFATDDYLTWFENGASSVDYQDLHQGYLEDPGDGNPDPTGNDYVSPYGPWYAVSLSSTVARPGDNMVAATSSNSLLRAHAVNRTDGQVGVVLINQDPTNNTSVNVSVSNATLAASGTQLTFGNADFSSGSWTANSNIGESFISGVGSNFTVTVPAYSATAILVPIGSFLLSNSGNINLVAGSATGNTSTVTVTPSSGFARTVGLNCAVTGPSGATSPATCSLASPSIASGAGTDLLTVTTTSTTSTGAYTVTVTGTSGPITQTTAVTVNVTPPPSFALTNSGNINLVAGATTGNTSIVTVTPSNGFTGTVGLTCAVTGPSGATSPATCNLASPSLASGSGTDLLTVTTTPTTSAGAYTITVTGTSGSITQTTAVTVNVTAPPPPGFSLSNSANITVEAGATTGNTSTVTITPSNSFSGAVSLTCAVTGPSGATSPATCSFASPSVTINGATAQTDTLTVTTTTATTAGAYVVTVTGSSGAITQTTTVNVTVTAYVAPTFALTNGGAITISSPGVTAGNSTTITVTPSGGFTGGVALTAAITTSPNGATDLPTLSFGASTPVTITGAAAQTGTLTVTTTAATSARLSLPGTGGAPFIATGGATLACVLLFGIRARRRRWLSMLGMLILLTFLTGGIVSCGGSASGGGGTGNPGTTVGNYTVTVTGTAGSTTETTVVSLTVN
jgi:hypothetical protein